MFNQRYRIFFSAEKIGGYSLTRFGQFLFFFISRFWKKKKTSCFFFPRKRLQATDSPERRSTSKKRSKPVKNGTFCRISVFFVVFFSQKISQNSVFFLFPGKDYTSLTHSNFRAGKKKTAPEKKKNSIFTHSLDFPQKSANFNLFRGNKKIRYLWYINHNFLPTCEIYRKEIIQLVYIFSYFERLRLLKLLLNCEFFISIPCLLIAFFPSYMFYHCLCQN